ncbi:MAG: methionyl-tRNA formyltransferase [Chloroflexota bacterium]
MTPRASSDGASTARTAFFGTGAFAVPILESLVGRSDLSIVGVVTPTDRPVGRRGTLTPVPLAGAAVRLGLPLIQLDRVRSDEAFMTLRDLAMEVAVLADFGQLIPQRVLDLPPLGFINVHPSLLPRHRGAAPIPATIAQGESRAGVSIMRMDVGLDSGPIIASRAWDLEGTEDSPALEARAAAEGAALLGEVLPAVLRGQAPGEPQDPDDVTLTRLLRREDGRLDPTLSAAELERQVRAYRPWPGTFVVVGGDRLAVLEAEVLPSERGDSPGRVIAADEGLALTTIDGRLALRTVQPAGRRPMSGADFRRGHDGLLGTSVSSSRHE